MTTNPSPSLVAFITIALAMAIPSASAQVPSTTTLFKPPVRLSADGQFIDTGPAWGHSGPCVEDLDRDGLNDLIVGDFGGKFRYYRNVGLANKPAYKDQGFLQAGGEDAVVRIYCCIGSQPRFCDLNGDGIRDLIANSYDPGHCYFFRGLGKNRFAPREELLDKAGVPIRSAPNQQQDYQSFGGFFEPVDWDDDGDFDLLIGCFDGALKLRINEGSATKPEFSAENLDVKGAAGPLQVKAHFCPVAADWNRDGLWDIIAGSDDGSVTLFRNIGTKKSPAFAESEVLVKASERPGFDRVMWNEAEVTPGIRAQVAVSDFNGDGQLDLLVGDIYTAYECKSDLTEQQKQDVEKLVADWTSVQNRYGEKIDAMRKDFDERYPGDKMFSDEADKAWTKEYEALRKGPEATEMKQHETQFVKSLRPYLAATRGSGDSSFDLAKSHGHVWLYLRK